MFATYFDVNVEKASFSHFEHETHLRTRRDTIEKTFFGMCVDVYKISSRMFYAYETLQQY